MARIPVGLTEGHRAKIDVQAIRLPSEKLLWSLGRRRIAPIRAESRILEVMMPRTL
jgi:hypothetical protein